MANSQNEVVVLPKDVSLMRLSDWVKQQDVLNRHIDGFDFREVQHADSAVLALMLHLHKTLPAGKNFQVHSLPESLQSLLKLYELERMFVEV